MTKEENAVNAPYGHESEADEKIPNRHRETPPRGGKEGKTAAQVVLGGTLEFISVAIADTLMQIKGQLADSWAKGAEETRENLLFLEGRKLALLEIRNFIREEVDGDD